MRLGSIAHKILESPSLPSPETLVSAGLADLELVFEGADWRELSAASPEREMPFIMHLNVAGNDCWIRGRMDAVVLAEGPKVVDYKYATWHEGAESHYEAQMTAYALALMKALSVGRATAELWYLKAPMKIVRSEYDLKDAERRLCDLLRDYMRAIEANHWPPAQRSYCDQIECGFREKCWRE